MDPSERDGQTDSEQTAASRSFNKLREAWLSAVTSAETELAKATARLRESLGLSADATGDDVMSRVRKHREEFERKLDEGVRSAIDRVRAPIEKEIASIRSRLEAVQERLETVKRRRSGKK